MIPEIANIYYKLLPGDFSQLYCQYYHSQGININIKPGDNVDTWLDHTHLHFNHAIFDTVFYYQAQVEKDEQFELCIILKEMIVAV
jgi:hypothetical protein